MKKLALFFALCFCCISAFANDFQWQDEELRPSKFIDGVIGFLIVIASWMYFFNLIKMRNERRKNGIKPILKNITLGKICLMLLGCLILAIPLHFLPMFIFKFVGLSKESLFDIWIYVYLCLVGMVAFVIIA